MTDLHASDKTPGAPPGNVAGIVLCGGASRRMRRAKAMVPFCGEPMLLCVLGRIETAVDRTVVVAAPNQELPRLSPDVLVVRDATPGQGPLEGLRCGLEAIENQAVAAYVTSCDVPLLRAAFARALIEQLGAFDAVVPVDDRFQHVLNAVYRTHLHREIARLQRDGKQRPRDLLDTIRVRRIEVDALRCVDPELESLANANTPEQLAALERKARLKG